MHVHCITCTLLNYTCVPYTVHCTHSQVSKMNFTQTKIQQRYEILPCCSKVLICSVSVISYVFLYIQQSRFMLYRWKSCSVTCGARTQRTVTSTGECSFVLNDFLCNRLLFRVGHPFDFICVADCFVDIVRFFSEVPRFHLTSLHASLITLHLHVCSFNVRGTCSKSDDGAAEIRIGSTSQSGGDLSGTDCSCRREGTLLW